MPFATAEPCNCQASITLGRNRWQIALPRPCTFSPAPSSARAACCCGNAAAASVAPRAQLLLGAAAAAEGPAPPGPAGGARCGGTRLLRGRVR